MLDCPPWNILQWCPQNIRQFLFVCYRALVCMDTYSRIHRVSSEAKHSTGPRSCFPKTRPPWDYRQKNSTIYKGKLCICIYFIKVLYIEDIPQVKPWWFVNANRSATIWIVILKITWFHYFNNRFIWICYISPKNFKLNEIIRYWIYHF